MIQANAKVEELHVIKVMQAQRVQPKESPVVFSHSKQAFVSLDSDGGVTGQNYLKLELEDGEISTQHRLDTFPGFFSHFVNSLGCQLETRINESGVKQTQELVLDCKDYQMHLRDNREAMLSHWEESFQSKLSFQHSAQSSSQERLQSSNHGANSDQPMDSSTSGPKQGKEMNGAQGTSNPAAKSQKANEAKKGLRRKMDSDEQLMRRLKLDAFEEFKETVLFRSDFETITSQKEIKAIQNLF